MQGKPLGSITIESRAGGQVVVIVNHRQTCIVLYPPI